MVLKGNLVEPVLELGGELADFFTLDGEVIGFPMARERVVSESSESQVAPEVDFFGNIVENELETIEALANIVSPEMGPEVSNEVVVHGLEDDGLMEIPSDLLQLCYNAEEQVIAEPEVLSPTSKTLKEEMKNKIKMRRMMEGKEDLEVDFTEPEPEKLTEEEEEKRRIKREKNKMAAQKCRDRKRKLAEYLQGEMKKLETKHEKLQREVRSLREERDHLQDLLDVHWMVCPNPPLDKIFDNLAPN